MKKESRYLDSEIWHEQTSACVPKFERRARKFSCCYAAGATFSISRIVDFRSYTTFVNVQDFWYNVKNPTKSHKNRTNKYPRKIKRFHKIFEFDFLKILQNEILISIFSQFSTLLHFDSKLNRASKETHITVQLCAKKLLCCRLVAKIGSFSNYMYCWFTELTTLQYTYRTAKQVLV